jgi:hypothetical protein
VEQATTVFGSSPTGREKHSGNSFLKRPKVEINGTDYALMGDLRIPLKKKREKRLETLLPKKLSSARDRIAGT